ncbi:hypothetical protein BCY76_014330 [Nesterenkonia sp. PF2B19]|nr:hypothetical protein BCY76_014330 [Nesterenkonia sp. PF2B19]
MASKTTASPDSPTDGLDAAPAVATHEATSASMTPAPPRRRGRCRRSCPTPPTPSSGSSWTSWSPGWTSCRPGTAPRRMTNCSPPPRSARRSR